MKRLLLVGAGHAHVYIMKKLSKHPLTNVEVVLISPNENQYYSGMLAGCIEGIYSIDQIRIYIGDTVKKAGIKWVKDMAVSIDPNSQNVVTQEGQTISYDLISFDIGSLTSGIDLPGVLEYADTLKPNFYFPILIEKVRNAKKLVIVGGGVAGTELALSLQTWRTNNGKEPLTLISSSRLMDKGASYVSDRIEHLLEKKGASLLLNQRANKVTQDKIILFPSGEEIEFDSLLWVTGPRAPDIFKNSGLAVDNGYLLVKDTLQSVEYPNIFGAGDCIKISNQPPLSKAGVYPVRQAPYLWKNMKRLLNGNSMRSYQPHFSFLSILATGNREGLMLYLGLAFHGRLMWLIKTFMDRRFIWLYQKAPKVGSESTKWLKVIGITLMGLFLWGITFLFITSTYHPVMTLFAQLFSSLMNTILIGMFVLLFIILFLVIFFERIRFK
ncbi:FAD-dependent oxidoreductase [Aquibacillus kalidii]|uniref:FAD-dependent oxidoreductase n=1 Tax=Aquibacillus kalidii TaxID=2762597 RepID=UPI0016473D29|nr:FAD-dependent oxidoreductase [Aquibacillus kalidii]